MLSYIFPDVFLRSPPRRLDDAVNACFGKTSKYIVSRVFVRISIPGRNDRDCWCNQVQEISLRCIVCAMVIDVQYVDIPAIGSDGLSDGKLQSRIFISEQTPEIR